MGRLAALKPLPELDVWRFAVSLVAANLCPRVSPDLLNAAARAERPCGGFFDSRGEALSAEQCSPERALMRRGKIRFVRWRRWNQRLKISGNGVEALPSGHTGAIRRSKFCEVRPVALHGAGEL